MSLSLLFSILIFTFVNWSTQQCTSVGIKQNPIDAPVVQMEWFNDEKYIYAMTESSIYVSHDEGQTWTKQALGAGTLSTLFMTAAENKQVALEYDEGKTMLWATENHGSTWKELSLDAAIWNIYPHPTDPNWIVAHTFSPGCLDGQSTCTYDLLLSQDFGQNWRTLTKDARRFSWGSAGLGSVPKETAYQLRSEGSLVSRKFIFERTQNLFQTTDKSLTGVVDFGYFFGILYLAQFGGELKSILQLMVSGDEGNTIKPARFPTVLQEHSYTIINGIQGLSYVAVDHSDWISPTKWGNVYVTDFTSDSYVLSLEYVVKDLTGGVDFSSSSIEGVQLANIFLLKDDPVPTEETEIASVVTFDNGGRWQFMEAPPGSCTSETSTCYLHLQGRSSDFGIETSPNAVGFIVGTGNTGETLDDEVFNTYMSRDAGLSWKFLYEGAKLYQFSDHGGLLLLANVEQLSNYVLYSWDQGGSFSNCTFDSELYAIEAIATAPSGTSQNFLISQTNPISGTAYLTHLDFTSLHEAQCQELDYEWWRPSDGQDDFCLLGREVSFKRRKQDSKCFNPEDYEKEQITTVCPCTQEDYGCDFCYQESKFEDDSAKCVLACGIDPSLPPSNCDEYYSKTQGYRLVAGDQCEGGLNLNPLYCDCSGKNCKESVPVSTTGSSGGTGGGSSGSGASPGKVIGIIFLLLLIFVVIGAGLLYYFYTQNDDVRKYVDEHIPTNWFGRSSNRTDVAYQNLEQPPGDNLEVDPFVDEEEATELADQDIAQMKTLNLNSDADFNPRDESTQPPSLI